MQNGPFQNNVYYIFCFIIIDALMLQLVKMELILMTLYVSL